MILNAVIALSDEALVAMAKREWRKFQEAGKAGRRGEAIWREEWFCRLDEEVCRRGLPPCSGRALVA